MKLNLGCGYNYLPGWVNADSDPACLPDLVLEAHDLPQPSGSAGEIKALQLVEHLGFFKTRYFLSECWRVLEPGGLLTLETPDIESTFGVFLSGGPDVKEAALGWVYGSETPGMNHLYCFPKDLLSALLAEAGFEIKETSGFFYQPNRPALRYAAVKAGGERAALASALRRRLLDGKLADLGRELVCAGQETVIKGILDAHGDPEKVFRLALYSAPFALEYFSLAGENEKREPALAAACERLAEWKAQGRLASVYAAEAGKGRAPREAYGAALAFGVTLLAEAAAGRPSPDRPPPADGAPSVFTRELAEAWFFKKTALEARADLRKDREIL